MFKRIGLYPSAGFWGWRTYSRLHDTSSSFDTTDDQSEHNSSVSVVDQVQSFRLGDKRRTRISFCGTLLAIISCIAIGVVLGYYLGLISSRDLDVHPEDYCPVAPPRREWTDLTFFERSDYIRAVRCMSYAKSLARYEGALFDDFAYVRAEFAALETAAFLPWNRYFLHVYEKSLIEQCGYRGKLPYWSWGKYSTMTEHTVFAKSIGFGGNGNITASPGQGHGHCVLDGSFSDLELKIIDGSAGNGSDLANHCLSRGFPANDADGRHAVTNLSSDAIAELLAETSYTSFLEALKTGPTRAVTSWVNGHFTQRTGPNDPLFILHLAQLDRLWWIWQMVDPFHRNEEYDGQTDLTTQESAKMSDVITLGGYLAPDITVEDVMATNYGGVLCYNYTIN